MNPVRLVLVLLLMACGSNDADHNWSPEEIGNAEYVFTALQADRRAAQIENLGEAGFDDPGEEEASLEHRQRALDASRSVRDDVLDKAHPALRAHFRGEFERSQELFLRARREQRADLETEAIQLRNAFGDWWVRHRDQVVVPSL